MLQRELIDPTQHFELASSSVIVNGILLDDLVDVYEYRMANLSNKMIVKMDIEGYEPFVFGDSGGGDERFFARFDIVAFFMEFGKIVEKVKQNEPSTTTTTTTTTTSLGNDANDTAATASYLMRTKRMLSMFKRRNYEPYEVNGFNRLDYDKWMEWPWDIFMRRCDSLHCPDHQYKLSGVV